MVDGKSRQGDKIGVWAKSVSNKRANGKKEAGRQLKPKTQKTRKIENQIENENENEIENENENQNQNRKPKIKIKKIEKIE